MKKYLILIFTVLLYSCQTEGSKEKTVTSLVNEVQEQPTVAKPSEEFESYLKLFPKTQLPIIIKGCYIERKGLKEFDGNEFKSYEDQYSLSYKSIPTNGDYTAIISLGAADCYLPILTTFKPNGEKIDSKTIAIGYCGSDCGYTCEEFMTIRKDFSVYVSDTITSAECDTLSNIIPGTTEKYVIYKTGKLLQDGRIELTEEIKKILK
ncbi:hypothetical protein [Rufibacter sp. XAAS-G3-1]|uniref:hypothetical protein n=1 Tax=Rufibacter sp. XAAS-G3-1 TaxID=2729134 RepID=UPI0015E6E7AE|nr:hypothetical protein [Rufibacter sp. XAAS-G3-1]